MYGIVERSRPPRPSVSSRTVSERETNFLELPLICFRHFIAREVAGYVACARKYDI